MRSILNLINRITDLDWVWWPFVKLKPAKTTIVTWKYLARIMTVFFFFVEALVVILFAVMMALKYSESVVFALIAGVAVPPILLSFGLIFKCAWNHRAKTLSS